MATQLSTDQLFADLKAIAADAEELLRLTADQAGDKLVGVRERLGESLGNARAILGDGQDRLVARGKAAAAATDDYVHDNPWRAIGAAAGVAFLLGLLIGRR